MTKISDLICYRDNALVVINKPPGMPLFESKNEDGAIIFLLRKYLNGQVFPVNRLDRRASGLVVFGRKKEATAKLNKLFQERNIEKSYLAVSRTAPKEDKGVWNHALKKLNRMNKSVISKDGKGKDAGLEYEVVDKTDFLFLFKLNLISGRHHQIRVQMAEEGCPIRGDVKYGDKRSNADNSINLHSWKLGFIHPASGEKIEIEAPLPDVPPWKYFNYLTNE